MTREQHYRESDDASITVIDRLLQSPTTGNLGMRGRDRQRESIGRDIELLLNTRREEEMIPAEYEETITSILNFGVPEITRFGNLSSPSEQSKLCKSLEAAIRIFEPRLRKVSVRIIDQGKSNSGVRFRLEAIIDTLSEREVWELCFMHDTGMMSIVQGGP